MSDTDYLSKWFNENEDSLYQEFISHVKSSSLCSNCDTNWGEMAYQRVDSISYMGKFSLQAKKYCDSIEVTYFYNRNGSTPTARILLSTDYNRKFIKPRDTLQDVTVFIHGNPKIELMTNEFQDILMQQLFGEEILLKKINDVDFRFADSIDNNLLSLEEARLKFK